MDKYSDPRQILFTLIRWWWVLALVSMIAAAFGFVINQNQTPVYEASTTVMVGGLIQAPQVSRDDIVARDAFTQAYAEMARRQPVLEGVVQTLELDMSWKELDEQINIQVVDNTPLIEIKAKASSPQSARAISGEIANQLILLNEAGSNEADNNRALIQQEIDTLHARIEDGRIKLVALQIQATSTRSREGLEQLKLEIDTLQRFVTDWEDTYSRLLTLLESNVSQNRLTIIEEALATPKPVSPHLPMNIMLSTGAGFMVAVGIVFFLDQFDNKIRTGRTLEQKLGMSHLGTIRKMRGKNYDGKLIASQDPLFGTTLFYRKILNNIGFSGKTKPPLRTLLITSPRLREGKSVTAANLGIVAAQAGMKTIIVDADWKKPVQHELFAVPNENGLMDLLKSSDLPLQDQLQPTGIPNLQMLTIGSLPENPIELLQTKRMKQALTELSKISNIVILDAPSTTIKESSALFELVDGVILVIDSSTTTMNAIKQSMTSLYLSGGKLLGGVLNRAPANWGSLYQE